MVGAFVIFLQNFKNSYGNGLANLSLKFRTGESKHNTSVE